MNTLALNLSVDPLPPETPVSKVEAWRAELRRRLDDFAADFEAFTKAEQALFKHYHHNDSRIDVRSVIEEIVSGWIKERCVEAASNTPNMTHLEVDPEYIDRDVGSFSFPVCRSFSDPDPVLPSGKPLYEATTEELIEFALTSYSFSGLESELAKASASIEHAGFVDAANQLGAEFGLTYIHTHHASTLAIKRQKGGYLLEMAYYGSYSHDRTRSINSLKPKAITFQNETNVYGLSRCLDEILQLESGISFDQRIESRTKIGNRDSIEGVFFKDKIKFWLSPEMFEALVGFVKTYTTSNLRALDVV